MNCRMTSRERVSNALALKEVDKIPWIELGFHGKIVGEIIGEEVILNTGFHSLEDPVEYEDYTKQLIKSAKKIGLDALHLKCWVPSRTFVETVTSQDSKVYKQIGKIKDEKKLEELEDEFLKNLKNRGDKFSNAQRFLID